MAEQTTIIPHSQEPYVTRVYPTQEQLNSKIENAASAQKAWATVPLAERIAIGRKFTQEFQKMESEIPKELTLQMGRPVSQGAVEVKGLLERANYMLDIAESSLSDISLESTDKPGFRRFIKRVPLGVILVIAPWNFPYLVTVNSVLPAIIAGNAVLLKPSPQTPATAERLATALTLAGVPKDIIQVLHLSPELTNAAISNTLVNYVSFTGSVIGGRSVAKTSAEAAGFTGVALELGGKDPAYVRADADLGYTVPELVDGAYFNSGQSCCSVERIYVHESIYDAFVEKFVSVVKGYRLGDPTLKETNLGPVVSLASAERIRKQVADAVRAGATSLIPDSHFPQAREGTTYVAPQVLINVDHTMDVMKEETFGPVVGIQKVSSDEEAAVLMNDSPYGLTASIWTNAAGNPDSGVAFLKLVDLLETGTVFLNRCDYLDPALAWVGVKDSGRGVSLSKFATMRSKGKGKKSKKDAERTDIIEKIEMENDRMFSYYKAQNIVPDEEWDVFVDSLRQHLPTTFRVAGSRETAQTLNTLINTTHVPALSDVVFEDQKVPPPVQIPWYPDGLAWQFNVPKKVLRKSPEFKKFHSFLVFETEVGNISRQEAVSMIPPLFLDIEPHHKVMDMCAAPGSKTAQILEALHSKDTPTSSIPSGLVLANDSDNKRTHLLIHQSARLPSPALMVTNLDASNYPSIRVPVGSGDKSVLQPLRFDRVLCDVPCSGDGTIRKNMGIWKTWQPMDGNGLHCLQLRILLRAMKMLQDDGRIVYSTCSLNPVENEAVVAEALNLNPAFELVDVSDIHPKLIRRHGVSHWRATGDRSCMRTFESYEEFMGSSADETVKGKLTPGHWPPSNVESLYLDRCMRILPHLQDSGGFFIAVLQKKVLTSSESDRKRNSADLAAPESKRTRLENTNTRETINVDVAPTVSESMPPAAKPAILDGPFKENPYTYLAPDDDAVRSCLEDLHIMSDFPTQNVLVRNPEGAPAKCLYISNDIVKAIILNNSFERLRLTSAGTKVFSKQETAKGGESQFRVLGEGLPVILPFIEPGAIINSSLATLRILLESQYPLCSRFDESFQNAVGLRTTGSYVVRFVKEKYGHACLTHDLCLPIWKSKVSLSLMIDKKAKSALSLRIFNVDLTLLSSANTLENK